MAHPPANATNASSHLGGWEDLLCNASNTNIFYPLINYSEVIPFSLVLGFLSLAGVVGNASLIVTVMRTAELRTTTHFLLINLAVADLLFLVVLLAIKMQSEWFYFWTFGTFACKLSSLLEMQMVTASIGTIVMIAVERFVAICYPLHVSSIFTRSTMIKVVAGVWVFAGVASLPNLWLFTVEEEMQPFRAYPSFYRHDDFSGYDMSGFQCYTVCVGKTNMQSVEIVYQNGLNVLGFILPALVLCCLYLRISFKLLVGDRDLAVNGAVQRSQSARGGAAAQDQRTVAVRKQVVQALALVTGVFFLCWAPRRIFHFFMYTYPDLFLDWGFFLRHRVDRLTLIPVYVNSMINPLIYSLVSTRFRKAFKRTMCGWVGPVADLGGRGSNTGMVRQRTGSTANSTRRATIQPTSALHHPHDPMKLRSSDAQSVL